MVRSGAVFILGAGASVDSGLPTYRGIGGIYNDNPEYKSKLSAFSSNTEIWSILKPMYETISITQPGPTYIGLQNVIDKLGRQNCNIMTQNIDGLALTINCTEIIELHGTWKTCSHISGQTVDTDTILSKISEYDKEYRPDIILYGDDLPFSFTRLSNMLRGKAYVIVIGTTLQFPYLHKLLKKARHKGIKIIHINPDPTYSGALGHDTVLRMTAKEGLEVLLHTL